MRWGLGCGVGLPACPGERCSPPAFKAAGRRPALLNTRRWNPVTTGLRPVASSGARPLKVPRVAQDGSRQNTEGREACAT